MCIHDEHVVEHRSAGSESILCFVQEVVVMHVGVELFNENFLQYLLKA